ncbi:MAG TPA: bifunctional hydroxymethylpyrimidine kinase/phosphomethylpyrimidine kinase [Gemmatimonadales bacterium]|nr:bifunctional hydroxymethylpyrimidine kinase/phosphomethylpyrimidine kinase [Gemmatimonadales bacterium]
MTIAGSDPGGGAGVQADLKTFHQFRVFGTSAITALTAQNTLGVFSVHAVPVEFVRAELDALADDLPPAAMKSGMLATRALVEAVAGWVGGRGSVPYVLDPVMVSTSGHRLLDADAEAAVRTRLVPLATVVTPNLDEAELLVGHPVRDIAAMEKAGAALLAMGAKAALIKGGHLTGATLVDLLVTPAASVRYERPRIDTTSTHGTGCTLSAAITAGLAHGRPMEQAVADALDFVARAIAQAPGLGRGNGPLNHFVERPT